LRPQNLLPMKILGRGTNWLGDAVMTTPALLRLREKFPDEHITLLTAAKLRELWQHHPAVDAVLSFPAGQGVWAVAKMLRAQRFDLALVLPNSPRSALEVFLAGIPQRFGYARPWRNFFLTQAVPSRPGAVQMRKRTPAEIRALVAAPAPNSQLPTPNPAAHQIHEYLHLAAALGADSVPLVPQLVVTPAEKAAARAKFGLAELTAPIFGLNPGAEYGPAKRWPVEKFIAAAQEIQKRTGCHWLIFGGKGDVELASRIAAEIHPPSSTLHPLNLAGQTTLRELMALLACCRLLLTNDTGPMHVAAALGTPVVVPFGSTSPELTGPGLPGDPRHHLLQTDAACAPCFLRDCPIDFRCLNGISVATAVNAVMRAAEVWPAD
jgi:heptosyltransferase-2